MRWDFDWQVHFSQPNTLVNTHCENIHRVTGIILPFILLVFFSIDHEHATLVLLLQAAVSEDTSLLVIDIQADIVVQEQLVLSQASQHVTLLSSSGNTLSGGGRKRILYISNNTKVTAHNIVFRDGKPKDRHSQSGGAVLVVDDGTFEAFQCLFVNNHGTNGGAIAAWNSKVVVEASVFYNNSANNNGGAVFNFQTIMEFYSAGGSGVITLLSDEEVLEIQEMVAEHGAASITLETDVDLAVKRNNSKHPSYIKYLDLLTNTIKQWTGMGTDNTDWLSIHVESKNAYSLILRCDGQDPSESERAQCNPFTFDGHDQVLLIEVNFDPLGTGSSCYTAVNSPGGGTCGRNEWKFSGTKYLVRHAGQSGSTSDTSIIFAPSDIIEHNATYPLGFACRKCLFAGNTAVKYSAIAGRMILELNNTHFVDNMATNQATIEGSSGLSITCSRSGGVAMSNTQCPNCGALNTGSKPVLNCPVSIILSF